MCVCVCEGGGGGGGGGMEGVTTLTLILKEKMPLTASCVEDLCNPRHQGLKILDHNHFSLGASNAPQVAPFQVFSNSNDDDSNTFFLKNGSAL